MWLLQPVALDSCRYLVPFSRYDAARDEPRIYHVLVHTCPLGSSGPVIIGPTPTRFLGAEAGRLYAITTGKDGSRGLRVHRLALPPRDRPYTLQQDR